jgi:hypothetical protein
MWAKVGTAGKILDGPALIDSTTNGNVSPEDRAPASAGTEGTTVTRFDALWEPLYSDDHLSNNDGPADTCELQVDAICLDMSRPKRKGHINTDAKLLDSQQVLTTSPGYLHPPHLLIINDQTQQYQS